jgi:hypothetical protein
MGDFTADCQDRMIKSADLQRRQAGWTLVMRRSETYTTDYSSMPHNALNFDGGL